MNRQRIPRAPTRTLAQLEMSQRLEAAIAGVLVARPIDESTLRRRVYQYVGEERHAGTSAGRVILALTELIEQSKVLPKAERSTVARRVILWCVDAYFGYLEGQAKALVAAPAHTTRSVIAASGESV